MRKKTIVVIHPADETTDFLKASYEGLAADTDCDVIVVDFNSSHSHLKEVLKIADLVVMMGHGTEDGLMGFGRFVVNSSLVYLLREKVGFYVWCNADKFVKKYGLGGFYTGMIISEAAEAELEGVNATEDEILESNFELAKWLGFALRDDENALHIMEMYYGSDSDVMAFNKARMYSTVEPAVSTDKGTPDANGWYECHVNGKSCLLYYDVTRNDWRDFVGDQSKPDRWRRKPAGAVHRKRKEDHDVVRYAMRAMLNQAHRDHVREHGIETVSTRNFPGAYEEAALDAMTQAFNMGVARAAGNITFLPGGVVDAVATLKNNIIETDGTDEDLRHIGSIREMFNNIQE